MKNRTAIGIVCIILAVAVTFVVSPLVNKVSDKKTEVVRFANDVSHGTEIKDSDVEVVKISTSSLPAKVIKDKTAVVGKYATADVFKGDFVTESKVTDNANTASDVISARSQKDFHQTGLGRRGNRPFAFKGNRISYPLDIAEAFLNKFVDKEI